MEAPDWIDGDPEVLRRWRAAQPEVVAPVLPEGMRIEVAGAEMPEGLVCTPARVAGEGLVLHFHGGGFVVGSPWTHRVVGAWIAEIFSLPVVVAAYPLAPENVLPTQAVAASGVLRRWAGTGAPILLSGDSAGAFVACLAYRGAKDARGPVRGMMTFYGVFGGVPRQSPSSDDEASGLGPRSLAAMYRRLDREGRIGVDPAFSPLDPDFPLPPLVIAVGAENDPVLSDTVALQRAHPGKVRLLTGRGLGHGFLSVARPGDDALAVLRRVRDGLRSAPAGRPHVDGGSRH